MLIPAITLAQTELMRFEGTGPGAALHIATSVGDVDGDGFRDFATGAPQDRTAGAFAGRVELRSGRTGQVLRTWLGRPQSFFGNALAGPGDVDGDGVPDLAISAFADNVQGRVRAGSVSVYSLRTGAIITQWAGAQADDWLGYVLDVAGDVDADGFLDLIAGAPQNGDPIAGYEAGYAQILSPRRNRVLRTLTGTNSGDEFGDSVAGCGDVDRDGHADVIVGAPLELYLGDRGGCARVFSGRTGNVLHVFTGRRGSDHFGIGVSGAGDVNVDGIPDLLVGGIDMIYADRPGEARLYSGRDGSLLRVIPGFANRGMFGRWVGSVGDFNHDGAGDIWVGSPMEMPTGYVRIFSGRNGDLLASIPGNGGGFGAFGRAVGDLDGDGRPEFAFGAPMEGGVGAVHIYSTQNTSTLGSGCSSRREAPKLELTEARLGGSCTISITSRQAGTPLSLLVGTIPALPLPIDTSCTLYFQPAESFLVVSTATGTRGLTRFSVRVANDPNFLGVELALQAVLQDRGQLEFTNGGLLAIRR